MTLVYGAHVPNAPFLIAPKAFGGTGEETAKAIRDLDIANRWQPEVILVASPHWIPPHGFRVDDSTRPRQIYDFSGFPPELNSVRYEPPGDPPLAHALVTEGKHRGIPVEATSDWGLDHGAWAPLLNLAPGATIPVVPLSISTLDAQDHLKWGVGIGAAVAKSLKRVAFLSTGSITHSFARMDSDPTRPWTQGKQIEQEVIDLVLAQKYRELLRFDQTKWRTIEPEGDLGPLFMLVGAIGNTLRPRLVATGQVHGAVGMTVIEFTVR